MATRKTSLRKATLNTKPVAKDASPTIGEYLIQRLQDYGLTDIFGIPGDFVLQF